MSDYFYNGPGVLSGSEHYYRDVTNTYRSPTNLASMAALMRPNLRIADTSTDIATYPLGSLNIPIGAMPNPMADYNFDADSLPLLPSGQQPWQDEAHSEHKDRNYSDIFEWYRRFLASPMTANGQLATSGPTAIAIGKE